MEAGNCARDEVQVNPLCIFRGCGKVHATKEEREAVEEEED